MMLMGSAEEEPLGPDRRLDRRIPDPLFDDGRIPAQASKQVLVQKIREAERDKQYDVYKDRIGGTTPTARSSGSNTAMSWSISAVAGAGEARGAAR